jgi:hypothetical protein
MKKRKLNLDFEYGWKKTDFVYPKSFLGHKHPAIYTWVLIAKNGEKSYYLGETSNLTQRVSRYMRPGRSQATNIRIKAEMDNSKEVLLYTIDINTLVLNGQKLDKSELEDKYTRRGLEGLLIRELKMRKSGHIIHNR